MQKHTKELCKINFKPQSVTTNFLLHSDSNIIKLIFPNKTKATIIYDDTFVLELNTSSMLII